MGGGTGRIKACVQRNCEGETDNGLIDPDEYRRDIAIINIIAV